MYLDRDERRTLSPQLALRVAIFGGVALVLFAIVFFRLWYLQVLSGDRYLAQADNNRVRLLTLAAPRGEVVDKDGRTLVDNRAAQVVEIAPDKLPASQAEKTELYARLGRVLKMPRREIRTTVREQLRAVPFSAATVKADVPLPVVQYLEERKRELPGVRVEKRWLRSYPRDQLAAHIFGTVGEVTKDQLGQRRYAGVAAGDRVGQSGIEYYYDRFLRGRNGARRVLVDARGETVGDLGAVDPRQGSRLRLSLDLDVQRVGQQAIAGDRGAFAVMNVRDGKIMAIGSSPSFDPNVFSKGVKPSVYRALTSKDNGEPLANRAIQGLYPIGSTMKLITAAAALQGGLITPATTIFDGGSLRVGGVTFYNDGRRANGPLALRRALTVSSDVFFFRLGLEMNNSGDGLLLQRWARRFGLGRPTGVDLPAELPGLVPSPRWRNELFRKKQTDRPWGPGDNVNLAVGQGDLWTHPLQVAVAYAALANGGTLVRPRLAERIEDGAGRVVQELRTRPRGNIGIDPANRQAILDGLRAAASAPGGTSTAVFKGFPIPVAGKTGTAEKGLGRPTQSWYAALWPYPAIKYVVVVTLERGGYGAETAAPAARRIIAAAEGIRRDRAPAGGVSD